MVVEPSPAHPSPTAWPTTDVDAAAVSPSNMPASLCDQMNRSNEQVEKEARGSGTGDELVLMLQERDKREQAKLQEAERQQQVHKILQIRQERLEYEHYYQLMHDMHYNNIWPGNSYYDADPQNQGATERSRCFRLNELRQNESLDQTKLHMLDVAAEKAVPPNPKRASSVPVAEDVCADAADDDDDDAESSDLEDDSDLE
jgi:hypothetical protein